MEVFGHLQSDESTAHHHGLAHAVGVKIGLDAVGVGHIAQGEDALKGDARQGRTHGNGPRREQQAVVGLGVFRPVAAAHGHSLGGGVDGRGLIFHAHINVETPPERLGSLHKQLLALGDGATYIIR